MLRQLHPGIQQPKLLIAVAIEFVSSQEALKFWPHLYRVFRLSCLCLDEPRLSFTLVKFGSHRTEDPLSSMFDVVAPIQSYLGYVTRGLDVLTSEAFENAGFTDEYSSWDSVDHFDRVNIREALDPSGSNKDAVPDSNVPEGTTSLKPFAVPKPNKRRSHLLSEDELTGSAARLTAKSSKG